MSSQVSAIKLRWLEVGTNIIQSNSYLLAQPLRQLAYSQFRNYFGQPQAIAGSVWYWQTANLVPSCKATNLSRISHAVWSKWSGSRMACQRVGTTASHGAYPRSWVQRSQGFAIEISYLKSILSSIKINILYVDEMGGAAVVLQRAVDCGRSGLTM